MVTVHVMQSGDRDGALRLFETLPENSLLHEAPADRFAEAGDFGQALMLVRDMAEPASRNDPLVEIAIQCHKQKHAPDAAEKKLLAEIAAEATSSPAP